MRNRFVGSEEHKRLFCETFIRTHVPFEPSEIRWPELDAGSLQRLKSLPVWHEAVKTEAETALKVQTLGRTERDPLLAVAIALQGYEEGRHAALLALLTRNYGIQVKPFAAPRPPEDPERAFLSTGYGECIDSFFAFGLFAIGKRSEYFPAALIEIFDPILQEEARHILFIVNWAAYLRARTPVAMKPVFELRRLQTIAGQLLEHARQAARAGGSDAASQEGFTVNARSAFGDLSARAFLELCMGENERRLAPYDPRLLRPALMPRSVRFALRFLPAGASGASQPPLYSRGGSA